MERRSDEATDRRRGLDDASASPALITPSWEVAYRRFESPRQESRRFIRHLRQLGADHWSRDAQIVDLFCGEGNGLLALGRLGFARIEGIDISVELASQYRGPGRILVADCRQLPLSDKSRDIAIVQDGLHHLDKLPDDLEQTLDEALRILRPGGLFVVVEPWLTPYRRGLHLLSACPIIRRLADRIDAFAAMVEQERRTYDQWIARPGLVMDLLCRRFVAQHCRHAWGKLLFVGQKA